MSIIFEIKMLCRTYCGSCVGVDALTVTIEVDVSIGISFFLVGLPDNAVRESQQRIGTALQTIGCKLPGKKIVINMAPADLKKEGSSFDLAIAIGILAASGQYTFSNLESYIIMGELALDGSLRPIKGALPIAENAGNSGFKACIFPERSALEAVDVDEIEIYAVNNLSEVVSILLNDGRVDPLKKRDAMEKGFIRTFSGTDFSEIKGQSFAKRALEIAAAGGHNVLMVGPPGSGKSFLAKALPSIMPLMNKRESRETSKIYSVASKCNNAVGLIRERPFRSPHHSSTLYALTGGGTHLVPGEISLSHNGILYLDEIPEFSKSVLEVLRQPLEDREISISRLKYKVTYPCNFMLVASMNPCPCGYYGDSDGRCVCSPYQVARYASKLSGPLIDRIDIHVAVNSVPTEVLIRYGEAEETSEIVRERVSAARDLQKCRFGDECNTNSQMTQEHLTRFCSLGIDEQSMLSSAINRLKMSARSYTRILKVARTIADLDNSENIKTTHLAESIQYRRLDMRERIKY